MLIVIMLYCWPCSNTISEVCGKQAAVPKPHCLAAADIT